MASLTETEAIFITAVVAAIVAIWGIITTRVVARRSATMEHFRRIGSDRDMIDARKLFIDLTGRPGGLATFACRAPLASANAHATEIEAIRTVLNDYEMLAVGVQFGTFDLPIIARYYKSTIVRDWGHAAPFIYKLRADLGSSALYHEFEELAHWLQGPRMPSRKSWTRLWF